MPDLCVFNPSPEAFLITILSHNPHFPWGKCGHTRTLASVSQLTGTLASPTSSYVSKATEVPASPTHFQVTETPAPSLTYLCLSNHKPTTPLDNSNCPSGYKNSSFSYTSHSQSSTNPYPVHCSHFPVSFCLPFCSSLQAVSSSNITLDSPYDSLQVL